jgi:triacylglycerol esterase/lipase EstA (alpha/beta hydrolase family)
MRRTTLKIVIPVILGLLAIFLIPTAGASAATSSGYNDWTCRPSTTHPAPVVLIHGTFANGDLNWQTHGPQLAKAGYCVFAPTYGQAFPFGPGGQRPIDDSAHEVAGFIDHVLDTTGAAKVDLIGHSQGALLSLYVPKVLGYAGKVDKVVALAPPTHGTDTPLIAFAPLVGCTVSCQEMTPGSAVIKALTTGPIAQPGVSYTIVATRYDTLVTPSSTAFVAEPGVHNLYVQDVCPADTVGHISLALDSTISSLLTNTLDPAGSPVRCGLAFPM